MNRLLIIITLILGFVSCNNTDRKPYDFDGLRDTLGLDSTAIFVEECSPYYSDDNPIGLDSEKRVKTMFYSVLYDEFLGRMDTAVYVVYRDNDWIFWGDSKTGSAKELIEHIIVNRKHY